MMVGVLKRSCLKLLKYQNSALESLACHAVRWRGFSASPIHPKHLFDEQRTASYVKHLRPGINFMDIGSGVGTDCILAAKRGARRVVGIEHGTRNYKLAVRRAREAKVDVQFIYRDLELAALPLDDKTFDVILFSNVLEHLKNRIAVLRELKRAKKENGIVAISVPNSDTSWKRALRSAGLDSRDDPDHKIEYSKASIRSELDQAGLEIVSPLSPIVPSFPWHGMIAISAAISPRLYRRLQRYKYRIVERYPEESIGWHFLAR